MPLGPPTLSLSAPYTDPDFPGTVFVDLTMSGPTGAIFYNIYESSAPGGPYGPGHVNLANVPGPTYRVAIPSAGVNYYIVRAVDEHAVEGANSNEVSVSLGLVIGRRRVCG